MMIEFHEMPTLRVHKGETSGELRVECNFDPSEPRAWTPFLTLAVCPCAEAAPRECIEFAVRQVVEQLKAGEQAEAIARVASGEATVNEKAACEILKVGPTKLNEMRKARQVPEPILSATGKNLWLENDIRLAMAALLSRASVARYRATHHRKRPANPREKCL